MTIDEILSAIDAEIATLQEARSLLAVYSNPTPSTVKKGPGRPKKATSVKLVKRVMSLEAKAHIAAGQKKAWSLRKKAAN